MRLSTAIRRFDTQLRANGKSEHTCGAYLRDLGKFKDWLRIDYTLPHPFLKDAKGEPVMGCPRLFVFDGRCEGFIDEVEGMPSDEDGTSVIDKKFPHDAIDAAKYWSSDSPGWFGQEDGKEEQGEDWDAGRCAETGY